MTKAISLTATIPLNGTTSDALDVQEYNAGSVQLPADFTGTEVAIHVSNDGATFTALQDGSGAAISPMTVTAGKITCFRPRRSDIDRCGLYPTIRNLLNESWPSFCDQCDELALRRLFQTTSVSPRQANYALPRTANSE